MLVTMNRAPTRVVWATHVGLVYLWPVEALIKPSPRLAGGGAPARGARAEHIYNKSMGRKRERERERERET